VIITAGYWPGPRSNVSEEQIYRKTPPQGKESKIASLHIYILGKGRGSLQTIAANILYPGAD
jgi:hypothetical protein